MQLGKLGVLQRKAGLSCKTTRCEPKRGQWVSNPLQNIFERDDGRYQIGWHESPGPFESRLHAEAGASRYSGDDPPDKQRRPRRANPGAHLVFVRAAASTSYAKPESFSTACYRVLAPNGLLIGTYCSRLEAAQASGVRP